MAKWAELPSLRRTTGSSPDKKNFAAAAR